MKPEQEDLLEKLPKPVLIALLRKHTWRLSLTDILGAWWEHVAAQAQQLREKSISIGRGRPYHAPEYQQHLKLWKQADALDKRANDIFDRLTAEYDKGKP